MAKITGSQLLHHGKAAFAGSPFPPNTYLITKPIQKGVPLEPSLQQNIPIVHYGQHIYVYNNIRTNQVVYSLTRHLNNKAALDQIPFLGKKTVPPRLRKDLWSPLCMVYFPSPHAGLAAYRKLREFRRLHETSYPLEIITETEGKHKGNLFSKKKRGKALMNQKANSVADLAAVLLQQERGPEEDRIANAERRMKKVAKLKMQKGEDKVKKAPVDVVKEMGGVEGVMVRWANVLDAEYAETWPEAVIHGGLEKSRYTAAFPVAEIREITEEVEEMKEGREGKAPLVSTLPNEASAGGPVAPA
ncbi:hypothetical protein MMC28_004853 [Mycoblastus sanguinarius]|nr:hypothetical protein [Mycoblastus sanguinarius]